MLLLSCHIYNSKMFVLVLNINKMVIFLKKNENILKVNCLLTIISIKYNVNVFFFFLVKIV